MFLFLLYYFHITTIALLYNIVVSIRKVSAALDPQGRNNI